MQAHTPLDLTSQLEGSGSAAAAQVPQQGTRSWRPKTREECGANGDTSPFFVVEKNFPSVMAGRLPAAHQRSSRLTDHLRLNARHTAALSNLMVRQAGWPSWLAKLGWPSSDPALSTCA